MGYFLARSSMFLKSVGIRSDAIRFRQHKAKEMAHYANDCWDAEVETSYGWIEIAGHADRSAFDLERHAKHTKVELMAARRLLEPIEKVEITAVLNKKVNGKAFKGDNKLVDKFFAEAEEADIVELADKLEKDGKITITSGGKQLTLDKNNVEFEKKTTKTSEEKYIPHVIEPAYGIGRIIYCVFEHCFKERERIRDDDPDRNYFDFPPCVAPLKCSILPLMNNADMNKTV